MRTHVLLCIVAVAAAALAAAEEPAAPAPKEKRFFEMRTYYAAAGKLDALQARFRNHAVKLFEKHGITNIGYWVPVENPENKLIYVLAYPDREAREKSWKEFMADPEWQAAYKESEKDGKLVAKPESIYMKATDFSPEVAPVAGPTPRTFELRIYKCTTRNLPNLLARFRDHTLKLFEKYGIANIAYWTPVDKDKGADDTLIYIVAHKSFEAADAAWKAFRADPDWQAAKKASEDKAGGSLTAPAPDGVKSTFMTPTDYSPMK
ncbi:MAG: NIPSNAP family protein [Planctomycetota bacterium]|nr:NIPSNAP family protein [Planctomycetota bacterium]